MFFESNSPTCPHGVPIGAVCEECSKTVEPLASDNQKQDVSPQPDQQIRTAKIGLVRVFAQQAKEGRMDREEVVERIAQLKQNNFITDEDVATLTRELDELLGL